MAISFYCEGVKKPKLYYKVLSKWLRTVVENFGFKSGELTYIFCDDIYLLEINKRFLNHDFYTDIVTFDYCEGRLISGDFFISLDRVSENSVIYESTYKDELLRVIVHGTLHLLGYNDSNGEEKSSMRILETECIKIYWDIENGYIK